MIKLKLIFISITTIIMDYQYQIKSLFIDNVEDYVNADYIAKVFYENDIATLSRITLIPYERCKEYGNEVIVGIYFKAYIEVMEWHNSPMAFKIRVALNDINREPRLIHDLDKWWAIKINNKPFMCYETKNKEYTSISILNEYSSTLNMQPIYYTPMTYYYTYPPIQVLPVMSMPMLPIMTY